MAPRLFKLLELLVVYAALSFQSVMSCYYGFISACCVSCDNVISTGNPDNFCGPYRTMAIQFYFLKKTTSI